jgi:hypothetical protein
MGLVLLIVLVAPLPVTLTIAVSRLVKDGTSLA